MTNIQAIDVHGHYGVNTQKGLSQLQKEFTTGDADVVKARARAANIQCTIVSPFLGLFPRGHADTVVGNKEAARVVRKTTELLQYVIVNPRQPATYAQARRMLKSSHCVGIKIHPEEHRYPIREYGHEIFEFAAQQKAVVLTHTGEENSWPSDFIPFANSFPEVRLILAHLGNGSGKSHLQVQAIQKARHGNVSVDTSSAQSIKPGLVERAVREIGADRILFGTDTPLYLTAMQRARIDAAEITDHQKLQILRENALTLFAEKLSILTRT